MGATRAAGAIGVAARGHEPAKAFDEGDDFAVGVGAGRGPAQGGLGFLAALLDGLAYLHGRGLVYQNVDPGSVVAAADGRAARLRWPVFCVPAGSPAVDGAGRSHRVLVQAGWKA